LLYACWHKGAQTPDRGRALLPDRALCLPTFGHLFRQEEEESLFKADAVKEEEEGLFKADPVNEEDPERDRATPA